MKYFYQNPSWKGEHYFGVSEEDLLELLDILGDDGLFGICWDTGHANLGGIRHPDAMKFACTVARRMVAVAEGK